MIKLRSIAQALLVLVFLTAAPALAMEDCCCGEGAQKCEMPASERVSAADETEDCSQELLRCLTDPAAPSLSDDDCPCFESAPLPSPVLERTLSARAAQSFSIALLLLRADRPMPRLGTVTIANLDGRIEPPPKLSAMSFSLFPLPPPSALPMG